MVSNIMTLDLFDSQKFKFSAGILFLDVNTDTNDLKVVLHLCNDPDHCSIIIQINFLSFFVAHNAARI